MKNILESNQNHTPKHVLKIFVLALKAMFFFFFPFSFWMFASALQFFILAPKLILLFNLILDFLVII
jgi:hypothetical protein